jgi:hypothetical protein
MPVSDGTIVTSRASQSDKQLTIGATWRSTPGLTPEYRPAPLLGQDRQYVLETLAGLDREHASQLIEERLRTDAWTFLLDCGLLPAGCVGEKVNRADHAHRASLR